MIKNWNNKSFKSDENLTEGLKLIIKYLLGYNCFSSLDFNK